MFVVLNAHAGGGRGAARWAAVEAALPPGPRTVRACADVAAARAALAEAAEARVPLLVAASGDGGVNLALNAIMDPATDAPRWDVVLGAVGLGSSNDFHKPRTLQHDLGGQPVALDAAGATLVDVGRADWVDDQGAPGTAYWLLNASFGATARGNWRYNHPTGVLAMLKRHASPEAAIGWATLEGVAAYAPVPGLLEVEGAEPFRTRIANLGIIKRVHFAGDMRYDTPVQPADGLFDVNLARDMSVFEFVGAVTQISRGRFLAIGSPKIDHWRAARVRVVPDAPTPMEYDGEVVQVREATFRVVPRALKLAAPGLEGAMTR